MSILVEIRRVECQLVGLFLVMVLMDKVLFEGWIGERLRVGVLLSE